MFVKLLKDLRRPVMDEDYLNRPVDDYLRQWGLEMYINKFQGKYITDAGHD